MLFLGTYSKLRPPKLDFFARSVTVSMNAVLFFADPTLVEKYREPDQPPTDRRALTPYMHAIQLVELVQTSKASHI